MRVISLRTLRNFWVRYPDADRPLRNWHKTTLYAVWSNLQAVRNDYPHADAVRTKHGENLTVFNIGGNKYRLIFRIRYDYELINIRYVLTHEAYDEGKWKESPMPTTKEINKEKLPGRFEALVAVMLPQAITDDVHYENTMEMIDRLMAIGKLTKGQSHYLETLVQLVEAYEASYHAIDISDISGLDSLKHLMAENAMSASDLARLLDVHTSMGSKILKGDRSLTVDHLKKLAARFKVSPEVFID